jgi:ABC-type sugar transport system substrate-binding protein
VGRDNHQGLVLAPNHPLASMEPVRRVLKLGIPVVIVSTELGLPADGKLGYIVNDDEKMGELAAAEIARLLDGKGSIALVGFSRGAVGVKRRARGAERLLARDFPNIRVVSRRGGAFSSSGAQENTTALASDYPGLNAVLGLTANATRGVHMALRSRSLRHDILIVGCEQDADLLNYVGADEISAIVAANTYRMAHEAVAEISEFQRGKPIPARIVAPPMLLTKQTLNSVEARPFISPLR